MALLLDTTTKPALLPTLYQDSVITTHRPNLVVRWHDPPGLIDELAEASAIGTQPGVCETSKRSQRSRNPSDSRFRQSPKCPQTIWAWCPSGS